MTLKAATLIAAALVATSVAAAPRHAAHKPAPAPKPTAAKPDAEPAAAPAPASAGPFDAREPSNLVALLASLGATAEVTTRDKQGVLFKVTSPVGGFIAQYDGCNQQGRVCAALQFDAAADAKTATMAEINGFNQSSLACRIVQDKAGRPHVLYSSLVFASTSRQDMLTHINAWRGCLADFGAFLKDPPGFLAAAP